MPLIRSSGLHKTPRKKALIEIQRYDDMDTESINCGCCFHGPRTRGSEAKGHIKEHLAFGTGIPIKKLKQVFKISNDLKQFTGINIQRQFSAS